MDPRGKTGTIPAVLAIDCGSTNLKAALFDASLARLAELSVPTPYTLRAPPLCELDPAEVRRTTDELIAATRRMAGCKPELAVPLAICSQAQTFMIADPAGRPRTPFISWLDARAVDEAATLNTVLDHIHDHGSFPHLLPQHQASKVLWLRNHHRHLTDNTPHQIVSLPSYVAWSRLGRNVLDTNLAAMQGFYSMSLTTWWPESLTACGISESWLPEPIALGTGVRGADGRTGVFFAGNDQTAGAYGNACRDGETLVTLGTALVAYRVHGSQPGPYAPETIWGPYPGGCHYELAVRDHGGLALDWAREQLLPGATLADFERLAAEAVSSVDARTPFFFPEAIHRTGAWQGHGSRAAMAYAAFEGIAFLLRDLVQGELQGIPGSRLRLQGGGSRSALWRQIIADTFGAPTALATGDALLGSAAMALGKPVLVTDEPPLDAIGHPDPVRSAQLDARFKEWIKQQSRRQP